MDQKLLLSVREAAKALSICQKTLWTLTQTGGIGCVRIGRRVLYDPRDLERWIDAQKTPAAEDRKISQN